MRTHIIILLITFLLSSPISADVRFNPNRSRGVPQNHISSSPFLSQSHITERRMQETNVTQQPVTIRLRGDTELGYYYATMFFGSPIQKQTLIVDTGSMTTTIPCQECGDNCGTHHFDKPFYHNLSATFELFNCDESFGAYTCGDCVNQCPFGVSYVEGSSYNGHFVRDYISFGNEIDDHYASLKVFEDNPTPKAIDLELDTSGNQTVLPDFVSNSTDNDATLESLAQLAEIEDIVNQRRLFMPFGCTFRETKLFYEQEADGILGLGVNTNTQSTPPNILDTLTIYNNTFSKAFTLCLAQQGGYFTMGGYNHAYHADETVQYANFYTEYGQYRVNIEKIEVGGKSLELDHSALNKGEGAFFDSGTTLTYAPTETYNAITAAVKNYCTGKKHCGKGVAPDSKLCWKYEKSEFPSLEEYLSTFPTLKFYFGDDGKAEYEWRPEDYLYEKTSGRYCIGLSRYDRETILGATFMKNHDILFDKQNNRVGMIRSNCAAVNNESTPVYAPAEETHQNSEINAIQVTETPVTETPGAPQQGGKLSTAVVPSNNEYQKTILISVFVVLGISLVLGVSIYVCVKFKKNSSYADMGPEVEVPSRRDGNASSDASMEHTGNQDTQNQENQNQQVALPVMEMPMPMPIPIGIPKMVVSSE